MRNNGGSEVLVAGGAGFLGSHLCRALLNEGRVVTCLDSLVTGHLRNLDAIEDHPRFRFVAADIIDSLPDAVVGRHYAEIYNLACPASPPRYQIDPEHTLMTSVVGTQRLLRLAERDGARLLLASTSEIYGDPLEHPQRESYLGNVNACGPRACYDEGKRAAETLAFDYDRAGRASVRVARIFNTYGPHLDAADGRVVSNLIAQALADEPMTLYGGGDQTRSFCFVDDLILGLLALMRFDGDQPGPVNLGNPDEITVRELAEEVALLTGAPLAIVHRDLPVDDPRRRRPDIARAHALLGWHPRTSLRHGLQETIAWFAAERASRAPAMVPSQPLVAAM